MSFRMRSAKGKMNYILTRDEGDTEIEMTVSYYFEPAWAASSDEPGSDASVSFTIDAPPGFEATDAELDEIERDIIAFEYDRQESDYEHAMDMRMEQARGN